MLVVILEKGLTDAAFSRSYIHAFSISGAMSYNDSVVLIGIEKSDTQRYGTI